jgi:hypothetical protein
MWKIQVLVQMIAAMKHSLGLTNEETVAGLLIVQKRLLGHAGRGLDELIDCIKADAGGDA